MSNFAAGLSAIADRYYTEEANRKPITYWAEYGKLFQGRQQERWRILELGVAYGASLAVWHDYLPNATIIGIDTGECPAWIAGQAQVHFIRASQDDTTALDFAARQAGGAFDLIIDDASHLGYLTKRSFYHLFPRWLRPGGHYSIEDFGTAFRPEYPDAAPFVAPPDDDATPANRIFASHQYGMVGVIKQLQDHMMQELMTGIRSPFAIEQITILTNLAIIRKIEASPNAAEQASQPR